MNETEDSIASDRHDKILRVLMQMFVVQVDIAGLAISAGLVGAYSDNAAEKIAKIEEFQKAWSDVKASFDLVKEMLENAR